MLYSNNQKHKIQLVTSLLTISGVLMMGGEGKITNPNGDFEVNENGFRVKSATTYPTPRAYALINSDNSAVGNLWYREFSNEVRLQTGAALLRLMSGGGGNVELLSTTGLIKIDSAGNIDLDAGFASRVVLNSPIKLRPYTTTQMDSLSAEVGDVILNTTANRIAFYTGSGGRSGWWHVQASTSLF